MYWGDKKDGEIRMFGGLFLGLSAFIALLCETIFLIQKPFNYKDFKVKYDTIKETMTTSDDVRDAAFTLKIVEINEEIRTCKTYINSKWVGIYYNKKICEFELLDK